MSKKPFVLVSLAAALTALSSPTNATVETGTTANDPSLPQLPDVMSATLEPNFFYQSGHDLMGMLVTEKSDGTIVAGHSSHASHSSHSSHSSSRY